MYRRDGRRRSADGHVPQQDHRTPRSQDSGDLRDRTTLLEGMKGLRGEDGINRGVSDRNLLGTPWQYLGVGG